MLLQIEEHHRQTCSLIFRWIALAFRPLKLLELATAIGSRPPNDLINEEQIIRDQIALCGPFLRISGHDNAEDVEINLVHESLKYYLLRGQPDDNPILESFRVQREENHMKLCQICLDYTERHSMEYFRSRFEDYLPLVLDYNYCPRFPLLHYAAKFWPGRGRCSSIYADGMFDTFREFFKETSNLRDCWFKGYQRRDIKCHTLLNAASYCDILRWWNGP